MQSQPGRIQIYTRDSQVDWNQRPAEVAVRRLDPPAGWQPRSEDAIAAAIIEHMPAWVAFWSCFKDDFLGYPEPGWSAPMAAMATGGIWPGAASTLPTMRHCW